MFSPAPEYITCLLILSGFLRQIKSNKEVVTEEIVSEGVSSIDEE